MSAYFYSCVYYMTVLFWKDFSLWQGTWPLQPKLSNTTGKTASFSSYSSVSCREDSDWPGQRDGGDAMVCWARVGQTQSAQSFTHYCKFDECYRLLQENFYAQMVLFIIFPGS